MMELNAKAKTLMDSDSGLGSDSDSWTNIDKGGTNDRCLRIVTLNGSQNSQTCQVSKDVTQRLYLLKSSGQNPAGDFIKGATNVRLPSLNKRNSRTRDGISCSTPTHGRFQLKLKNPEFISSSESIRPVNEINSQAIKEIKSNKIANNINFHGKGKRFSRSPRDEPINPIAQNYIDLDKNNKTLVTRCDKIVYNSQNNFQTKPDHPNFNSNFKSKMFSSQISLNSVPNSSDISICPRGKLKYENNFDTFGRRISNGDKKHPPSSYRSEESLLQHRQYDLDQSDKFNKHLSVKAQNYSTDNNTNNNNISNNNNTNNINKNNNNHASIKNRNALNLRLIVSALSNQNPRESTASPPSSSSNNLEVTTPSKNCRTKTYGKARSLDSTPQSTFEFNASSLPLPDKTKRSAFMAFKKFFSLRPKSTEVNSNVRCRRKLFSEGNVIHEEEGFDLKPKTFKARFSKNEKGGQAWLVKTPESAPSTMSLRSRSVTPTSNHRIVESETARDSMKIILLVFKKSSKNRIIKQLKQLECTDVNENSRSVTSEESFQIKRKEFMTKCQMFLSSFRELSLSLLTMKGCLIQLQTAYYKNSELYVQHLDEFLESSQSFIEATFASRVKYQLKTMAKEVAKEGFMFLESSYECVLETETDEAYTRIDEQFKSFSAKFAKLIKWTKELEYCDTVSVLW